MNISPKIKSTLSVAAATFISGAVGAVLPFLSDKPPTTAAMWKSALIVALIGGLTSLKHLFDPSPFSKPDVPPAAPLAFVGLALVAGAQACSPAVPTPAQQASVGLREAAYQGCIAQAKLLDAGHAERVAEYKKCADAADKALAMDGGL